MTRPGVNVSVRSAPAPTGPPTDTGVSFVLGETERGPITGPVLVRNMTTFEATFGGRVSYSILWDALDTYFRDGGLRAYVQRYVGGAASVGSHTFADRAGSPLSTIAVDAVNPGEWSADLDVQVADGDGDDTFELFVFYQDVLKERSGDLASPAEAVTWSANSDWVRVRNLASATAAPDNNPAVVAATALSAGSDDRGTIDDDDKAAALDLIPAALGPGQVWIPGATTDASHQALLEHAAATNRTALPDAPDDGLVATLVAAAVAIRSDVAEPERGGLLAPQIVVPGLTANTTRTVPASCVVAALMARNDAVNGTGVPAAGRRGQSRYAIGVTHEFTDAERETLNDAGVDILRPLFGPVTLYGYRTVSLDTNWRSLADQRLRMEIVNEADILGEEFMFDQIDGEGRTIAAYAGALTGLLAGFYNRGSLYGSTPAEAFNVNVDESVNTPETIAAGELHAVLGIRMSPFAEMVFIEIVKYPITQSL